MWSMVFTMLWIGICWRDSFSFMLYSFNSYSEASLQVLTLFHLAHFTMLWIGILLGTCLRPTDMQEKLSVGDYARNLLMGMRGVCLSRSQMQTIITKACKELDIQPVPSQRVLSISKCFLLARDR